jgi:DNA-binding IscR family transcriptional regulator
MSDWTLFSNHGHVLVCLANNHAARLRDVAASVGITERAVQNILRELQGSGMVTVSKHGRCNHYQINTRHSLRHPLEAHCTVGKLLQLLDATEGDSSPPAKPEKDKSAGSKSTRSTSTLVRAKATTVKAPADATQVVKVGSALTETIAAKSNPPEEAKHVSRPEPKPETKPEPGPESEPESKPGPLAKSQSRTQSKTQSRSEAKPKPDPEVPPTTQQGSLF